MPWYGISTRRSRPACRQRAVVRGPNPDYPAAADEAAQYGRTWYPPSLVPYTTGVSNGAFQTWYDDFDSLTAKYSYAANNALHGVAVFALGYDGGRPEELWDALQNYGMPVPDTLVRLAGNDRYATAAVISRDSFPVDDGAQCVVLATGTNWPDALGGAVLARACNGPLLLTTPNDLLGTTADEIARVLPPGGMVHLLGGTAALSTEVENDLHGLGFATNRLAGSDRVTTASVVADFMSNGPSTVVIGTKDNFPDVLSIGGPAAENLYPVLLTARGTLSTATRNFLRGSHGASVKNIYVAGGTSAVSTTVTDQLTALGYAVTRLAGTDRYATSAAIATNFYPTPTQVTLATGTNFADGLTGAANAAGLKAPILLVTAGTLPTSPWSYLEQHALTLVGGRVYGGFAAVSRAVQDVAQTLIVP
ncbi:MAG: cell wall-binding repeat-containing protein [Candidatus Andersenbacteria bacterium]